MRTITLEEHFNSPRYVEETSKVEGETANAYMAAMAAKLGEVGEERIADMDAAGIDVQVLSLTGIRMDALDAATGTSVARDSNDWVAAKVEAYPGRFAAFAALGMKEPDKAADELVRCCRDLGFKGAMISGTIDGAFLDHARFTPVLEAAQALGVPIYVHPAPPPVSVREAYFSGLPDGYGLALSMAGWGWHVETGLHALRMIAGGVFDRFPRLQVIVGHMGENLPFSIARAEGVFANAGRPLQRPASEYLTSNFYVTTSGYFTTPPFLCALMVMGADRLMFSIDYPFSTNARGRAFLDSLPVSPADKEKIAHVNAERLLRL